jgi:hypothetical protein
LNGNVRFSLKNDDGHEPNTPMANIDPVALLLDALVWTLGDGPRAERFLALTGLHPNHLREKASDPATLIALTRFLADHEPDLIGCADALGVTPPELLGAARLLHKGNGP